MEIENKDDLLQQLPSNPIELFDQIETTILNDYTTIVLPSLEQMKKNEQIIVTQQPQLTKKKIENE